MEREGFGQHKVLVVDDDPAIRGVIEAALAERGASVTPAATKDEACNEIAREEYSLILTDLRLGSSPWSSAGSCQGVPSALRPRAVPGAMPQAPARPRRPPR